MRFPFLSLAVAAYCICGGSPAVEAKGAHDKLEVQMLIFQFGTLTLCNDNGILKDSPDLDYLKVRLKEDADHFGLGSAERDEAWSKGKQHYDTIKDRDEACLFYEHNLISPEGFYPPPVKQSPLVIEKSPLD